MPGRAERGPQGHEAQWALAARAGRVDGECFPEQIAPRNIVRERERARELFLRTWTVRGLMIFMGGRG